MTNDLNECPEYIYSYLSNKWLHDGENLFLMGVGAPKNTSDNMPGLCVCWLCSFTEINKQTTTTKPTQIALRDNFLSEIFQGFY